MRRTLRGNNWEIHPGLDEKEKITVENSKGI
jgi:hypothetical protein